jgi:hypothetical protein
MNRLILGLVAATAVLGASARSIAMQDVKAKVSLKMDWQSPNYKRSDDRHEVRTDKREVREVVRYVRVDREECDEHCRKHHKHKRHCEKEFHDNRSEQGAIHGRGPEMRKKHAHKHGK